MDPLFFYCICCLKTMHYFASKLWSNRDEHYHMVIERNGSLAEVFEYIRKQFLDGNMKYKIWLIVFSKSILEYSLKETNFGRILLFTEWQFAFGHCHWIMGGRYRMRLTAVQAGCVILRNLFFTNWIPYESARKSPAVWNPRIYP